MNEKTIYIVILMILNSCAVSTLPKLDKSTITKRPFFKVDSSVRVINNKKYRALYLGNEYPYSYLRLSQDTVYVRFIDYLNLKEKILSTGDSTYFNEQIFFINNKSSLNKERIVENHIGYLICEYLAFEMKTKLDTTVYSKNDTIYYHKIIPLSLRGSDYDTINKFIFSAKRGLVELHFITPSGKKYKIALK